jgi:hypothetical protein
VTTYQFQIFLCTNGLCHNGSLGFIDDKLTAHTGKWRQNIRKENAAVGLVIAPGLQRNFDGHFGDFTPLTKGGIFLAEVAIGFDVTTSLSHHPNRSAFDIVFSAGGPNQ